MNILLLQSLQKWDFGTKKNGKKKTEEKLTKFEMKRQFTKERRDLNKNTHSKSR